MLYVNSDFKVSLLLLLVILCRFTADAVRAATVPGTQGAVRVVMISMMY